MKNEWKNKYCVWKSRQHFCTRLQLFLHWDCIGLRKTSRCNVLYCRSITHKWKDIRVDRSRFLQLSARGSVNSLQKSHWRVEGMSSCRETLVCMLSQRADASYGMRRIYLYSFIHKIHTYMILYIYYIYRNVHVIVPGKRLLWTLTFCVLPALTNVCKDWCRVLCLWFNVVGRMLECERCGPGFGNILRIWESC